MAENIESSYIEEGTESRGIRINEVNNKKGTSEDMDDINSLLSRINPEDAKDSILALGELDAKIDEVKSLNELEKGKIIDKLSFISNEQFDNSTRGLKRSLDYKKGFISGINDLLSDLQNNNGLFSIEDKYFQKCISTLVVERDRALGDVIMENSNTSFISTAERLDNSINSNSKVVLIGINDYLNGNENDLGGAVNDVNAMKEMVINIYGISEENIIIITDLSATKDNILETIEKLSSTDSDDNSGLLVYYAGHGISKSVGDVEGAEDGESFIVPTGFNLDDGLTTEELISANEISEAINGKGLVITDMCYSGGFTKNLASDLDAIGSSNNEVAAETNVSVSRGLRRNEQSKINNETNQTTTRGLFSFNFTEGMNGSRGDIGQTMDKTSKTTLHQEEIIKISDYTN